MGNRKISIIGAGKVGSTLAQILAYKGFREIVLWNRTLEKAQGIALDIMESAPIDGFDCDIKATASLQDIEGSEVVVVTAGIPRRDGMSREDLLSVNAAMVSPIAEGVGRYSPDCKLIVLTNPLDAMVYLAMKKSAMPKRRVIGMAGILDSARFSEFIAMDLGVSTKSVSAMVLGSHGDSMVPLIRHTKVAGIPIGDLMQKERIDVLVERTRNAGAEIIKLEMDSSAFYAPASSLALMVDSIINDRRVVLPCSAYLEGEYGVSGIFMGVPVSLGRNGIEKIIQLSLSEEEKMQVKSSAEKIRSLVSGIKI
jgi:malate dehydrogenase